MNINKPVEKLGAVQADKLLSLLPKPQDPIWGQGDFRNDYLAAGAHDASRNLVRRHEWFNRDGIPEQSLDEAINEWQKKRSIPDPHDFSPCKLVDTTTLCSVYEFPITPELDAAIDDVTRAGVVFFATPVGVVLRSMVTMLAPGKVIHPHRDGGLTARLAHRIHIPLTDGKDTVYRIGGRKLKMDVGYAYDFNNRWIHSVENNSSSPRINLIIDYLEDPAVPNPWSRYGWRP